MVDADQDSLNFLLSVTKLQRDFFLTVGPLPPVLKISYFRKLAIVNSLCALLRCKSSPHHLSVLQLRNVFLKDLGSISVKHSC